MGTGGRGNIVHIDNLYVKTFNVKDNVNILLGDYVIFETGAGMRPLVVGDFTGDDTFLDLELNNLLIAGEDANNLDTTDPLLKKNQIECLTKGTDWTLNMRAGVDPDKPIGILRVDAGPEPFQAANAQVSAEIVATKERLGIYKHKEFSTVADTSAQDDNGIVSTGLGIA